MNATHSPSDPNLDTPFARALRDHLDAEVSHLPAGRGPAAAAARARARRRNRRAVVATAVAAAVVASTTLLLPDDPARTSVDTASGDIHIDPTLRLDWTVTDDGLAVVPHHTAGGSGLYAVSTAPRTRPEAYPDGDAPRAMYRLADDGTWTPVALEDDDPRVAKISERDGVLYALSTGTAARAQGFPIGSMSVDGGQTWSSVPLEVPEPPSDQVAWGLFYDLDIASTPDHTFALVTARFQLPYEDVFPELLDGHAFSIETTSYGVDLINDAAASPPSPKPVTAASGADESGVGEVVRSVSWEELGVSDPARLTQPRAYVVEDGQWQEVPAPDVPTAPVGQSTELQAFGSDLLLTSTAWEPDGSATTSTLRSADGRSWTPLAVPPGQLLPAGEALLQVGHGDGDDGGFTLQVSHDRGATWQVIDPAAIDPALAGVTEHGWVSASSGPLGVALTVGTHEEPGSTLLFSTDARAWVVEDLESIAREVDWFERVLVGTDRLVVLGHTDQGEPGSPERSVTLTAVPRRT